MSVYLATRKSAFSQNIHESDKLLWKQTQTQTLTALFYERFIRDRQGDLEIIQGLAAVVTLLCLSTAFKTDPLGPGAKHCVWPATQHRWPRLAFTHIQTQNVHTDDDPGPAVVKARKKKKRKENADNISAQNGQRSREPPWECAGGGDSPTTSTDAFNQEKPSYPV